MGINYFLLLNCFLTCFGIIIVMYENLEMDSVTFPDFSPLDQFNK